MYAEDEGVYVRGYSGSEGGMFVVWVKEGGPGLYQGHSPQAA